ncbi:MAG: lipopolysaccharide kinase InaA family protein [Steroidobacteraceae bacterium]
MLPASDAHLFSKWFKEEWLFRATLRNSLRAAAAAERSSWLHVPRVLHTDCRKLRIDYEFLPGWSPLHTVLRHYAFRGLPAAELRRMFWTIGAALEEFHRHTHRIHGDFDLDNILVKRGSERIAFVDFTPPEYACFRRYNQGSPYRDIATLLLFVRAKYPPHQLFLAYRPQLRELARAFIEGYFHAQPAEYDQHRLQSCTNELLDTTYLGRTFTARFMRNSRLYRTDDLALGQS